MRKRLCLLLAAAFAAVLTGCDSACTHDYTDKIVAPTCTASGYTLHTCKLCGDYYSDSVEPATGHNYTPETKEATCLEAGYTVYTCSNCGDSYRGDEKPATGHNYTPKTVQSDCVHHGGTVYTCSACGDSYTEGEQPLTDHTGVGRCQVCDLDFFADVRDYIVANGEQGEDRYTIKVSRPDENLNYTITFSYLTDSEELLWTFMASRGLYIYATSVYIDRIGTSYSYLQAMYNMNSMQITDYMIGTVNPSILSLLEGLSYTKTSLTSSSTITSFKKLACTSVKIMVVEADLLFAQIGHRYTSSAFNFA